MTLAERIRDKIEAEGPIPFEEFMAFALYDPEGGFFAAPRAPLPDFSKWGEIERKPMSGVRRKTSEHLTNAWTAIPHVTQFDKADMTVLEEISVLRPHVTGSNIHTFDDPELLKYPVAYVSEPGYWIPSDSEVEGLRRRHGKDFLVVTPGIRPAGSASGDQIK